jgi:8-oxo-dGTP pyrophosphatase MutT (NUDIX family)
MAVPEFVTRIRSKLGHDPLPLPGVTAVVRHDDGRILLVRRADNHRWTLVTGCLEPPEQPATAVIREVWEETGVVAEVQTLLRVESMDLITFPNSDQVYMLDLAFGCRAVGGEPRVNDDESIDAGWFELDRLPDIPPRHLACITAALHPAGTSWFAPPVPLPAAELD